MIYLLKTRYFYLDKINKCLPSKYMVLRKLFFSLKTNFSLSATVFMSQSLFYFLKNKDLKNKVL